MAPKPAGVDWRHLVRLVVPTIFALCGVGSERHQLVHVGIVEGELEHVPPGAVPADEMAVLEDSA